MIAFVLSGGGSRGALEVGALLSLFERGIKPQILVGSSAGAMNAAFMATDPTLEGAQRLAALWRSIKQADIFPGNPLSLSLTAAWRFVCGYDGLFPSDRLRRLVERYLPEGVRYFSDITKVRLYLTAADLNWGILYLWGEKPEGEIVEAVMASAAHPAYFPPLLLAGHQLVDGAVIANVPISIAAAKGATEVYAINVGYAGQEMPYSKGVFNIVNRAISTMMYQQLLDDLMECTGKVILHHVFFGAFADLPVWDLSKSGEMIDEGRRVMGEYLEKPVWERVTVPTLPRREEAPEPPPGAVAWRWTRM